MQIHNIHIRTYTMVLVAWVTTGIMPACTILDEAARETSLELPADKALTIRNSPVIELSPDGDYLAYPVDVEGGSDRMLYLQPLDGSPGRILPGTADAEMPFFSPDGRWIAFFSGGELRKVALAGGDPVSLCEATAAQGGSWGSRGSIVFATDRLWEVSADGGLPRAVTQPGAGEYHRWPRFLPDGDHVLFNRALSAGDVPQVAILHIDSGRRATLLEAGSFPSYAATGHVVFADTVSLHAAPLDLQRMQITGDDVRIAEGVLLSTGTYVSHYTISRTGTLVYVPGGTFGENRRVVLLDNEGNERDAGLPPDRYSYVRFSPDGSRLALQVHVSWAPSEDEALQIAHEQWRTNVFSPPLAWDLATVEEFDEAGIVDAIERAVERYREVREPGERFVDTYRRVGMDGFKEAIYGA